MGGTATSSGLWGGFVEELLVVTASVAVLLGFFLLVGRLRARLEGGATEEGSVPSGWVLEEVRVVTAMVGLVFYLGAE